MSSKLKAITTKAKQLYKTGKFAKWTDAIKEASKSLTKGKKVSGVKKAVKKVTKKKAVKKVTKKKATPKSYHKDTKSHNVKISVMSGVKQSIEEIKTIHNRIAFNQGQLQGLQNMLKHEKFDKKEKNQIKQNIKLIKLKIADYKKHLTSLKKHI